MIGMVAGITEKDAVNHTAPILCGGQGLGKTRWISGLVPKQLYNYFFSGTINMKNKDSITQLSECFLIDMDELENLSKKSIGDLKSMMSKEKIRIRRPYGKIHENLKRRASFIGSINDKEFLKDDTGSRRFLCFELEEINNEHSINIDNLFSQALALFNSGFQYWFNKSEEEEIQISNEQFYKTSLEAEYLMRHFEPIDIANAKHFLSATDIANILKDRERLSVNDTTLQRICKFLTAKKFVRLKKNNRYVWAVFDKWNYSVGNSKAA
jgi:predicted P-loop ATPase